jgi:hypothetical protein
MAGVVVDFTAGEPLAEADIEADTAVVMVAIGVTAVTATAVMAIAVMDTAVGAMVLALVSE